jgi:chromate transporter
LPLLSVTPAAGVNVSHAALFSAFLKIGVLGFGGVAGWVRQVLVDERGYLDDCEFAALQGVASILPGANTVNLAVMLGDRYKGALGALSALAGLLLAPLSILVVVATLYERLARFPDVGHALAGAAAATAGLVIANAYKMARGAGLDIFGVVLAGVTFLAIGILKMPLATTLAVLVPSSLVGFALMKSQR